jgi:hypothetical protein
MTRPEDARPARGGDLHPTAEMPGYARGSAKPQVEPGTGWPDEASDLIGKPLDTGRFDDAARVELAPPRRGLRGLFWLAGIMAVIVVAVLGLRAVDLWPHFSNPFVDKKTDRSQPVLLKSIQDLSRFVAASGNFEVIIDVQQNKRFIPDIIFNERTLFVAAGSVDAYVDFAGVNEGALKVDEANRKVEIQLPAAQLEKPNIDHERSYVFAQQRGIVNRVGDLFGGDPNKQQQLYQLAEQKIGDAAKASELAERARKNTQAMLEGMLRSLGYTTVIITFAAP